MIPEVAQLRGKAHDALATARHDLEGGFVGGAVNRAYYAAFHMARAALLLRGEAPRTHKGVQRQFLLHFVQAGLVGQQAAAWLTRAARMRETADYDDAAMIEPDEAEALIQSVEHFVAAVEPLLAAPPDADR